MRYFIVPIVNGKNDDIDFRDYVDGFQAESNQRYIAMKDTAKVHQDWIAITKVEYEAAKPVIPESSLPIPEPTNAEIMQIIRDQAETIDLLLMMQLEKEGLL